MSTVTADDGEQFDPDSSPITFSYNGDSTVNYAEVQVAGKRYRQAYTYANGQLTGIGRWVKQ